MNLKTRLMIWRFKLSQATFRWVQDDDGDIGIEILRIFNLLKYKDTTVIKIGYRIYKSAPKWSSTLSLLAGVAVGGYRAYGPGRYYGEIL